MKKKKRKKKEQGTIKWCETPDKASCAEKRTPRGAPALAVGGLGKTERERGKEQVGNEETEKNKNNKKELVVLLTRFSSCVSP